MLADTPDPRRTGMPKCACGDIAYQPDPVAGRQQAWRCGGCHRTLSRCNCTPDPRPVSPECPKSKRADGKHSPVFDGDDPYTVCAFCGERRDALSGRVIRPVSPPSELTALPLTTDEEATLRRWAKSASPSARAKNSRMLKRLLATLDAARAVAIATATAAPQADEGLRAAWIEGWMQGAGQMTTWPPESLHSEAVRQFERRAALSQLPEDSP